MRQTESPSARKMLRWAESWGQNHDSVPMALGLVREGECSGPNRASGTHRLTWRGAEPSGVGRSTIGSIPSLCLSASVVHKRFVHQAIGRASQFGYLAQ